MSLEKDAGLQTVQLNAELESLVNRVVEQMVARIGHAALKPFVSSKECAGLLGVTPEHLCAMRARGAGPPWSGSGRWTRYERRAVLAWIAALPQEQSSLTDVGATDRARRACPESQRLPSAVGNTHRKEKDAAS